MKNDEVALGKQVCESIKEHRILQFYYESSSGKYWRKVEPYILATKDKGLGNTFFTGYVYPSKERKDESSNDDQGQFLLKKIDPGRFEVLDETFHENKLNHNKIFGELPTIKIICRVKFKE
jgi:hypothetical protein